MLCNLPVDPDEENHLAGTHPGMVTALGTKPDAY
jgi:hypothetical protein